jgi:hypothetical protein
MSGKDCCDENKRIKIEEYLYRIAEFIPPF